MEPRVYDFLAGPATHALSILGDLDNEVVGYYFTRDGRNPVSLHPHKAPLSDGHPRFSVNLKLSELRLDSGRLIGARRLSETLLEVIDGGKLHGRKAWHTERLLSRLQYLDKVFWGGVAREYDLKTLREQLQPHRDEHVVPDVYHREGFSIAQVLEDINYLIDRGVTSVTPWWMAEFEARRERRPVNFVELASMLDEHFRRSQIAYREVCEENFGGLAPDFGMYRAMPMRWEVGLLETDGVIDYMDCAWLPVPTWQEAGANCIAIKERRSEPEEQEQRRETLLSEWGRSCLDGHLDLGSYGILPVFRGYQYTGVFDGRTSAYRQALEWLKADIESLFANMPRSD